MEEVIDDFIGNFWTNDRTRELEQLAAEHGWEFSPRERFAAQPTALKGFNVFKGKHGKRITGVMHLPKGSDHSSRIYDYVYYGNSGKKKTTVIEMTCHQLHLSPFSISPKKGLSHLFSFTTRKRNTSGIEKFSGEYQMAAADPEATDIQIPDSALGLIAEHPNISLEGDGNVLLYYHYRKLIPPQDLIIEHALALEILSKLLHDREKEFV